MTKRIFDIIFSLVLLLCIGPILVISCIVASIDTKSFGIFSQLRVGQYGKLFKIYKLKTMRWEQEVFIITSCGAFFRKYKLDEFPQLLNILKGEMSFVGPRPDIPGYYDVLKGKDSELLVLKPGLTSRASIKYRNEEELLKQQKNPLLYNDTVIFPDKVKINLDYLQNQSLKLDLLIIYETLKTYIK